MPLLISLPTSIVGQLVRLPTGIPTASAIPGLVVHSCAYLHGPIPLILIFHGIKSSTVLHSKRGATLHVLALHLNSFTNQFSILTTQPIKKLWKVFRQLQTKMAGRTYRNQIRKCLAFPIQRIFWQDKLLRNLVNARIHGI